MKKFKTKRQTFCGMLMVSMAIMLLSAIVFANPVRAKAATTYGLSIGGYSISDSNTVIDSNDNTAFKGSAEYNPTTHTLTLNNFDNGGLFTTTSNFGKCGIYYTGTEELTIKLVGNSTISINAPQNSVNAYGICYYIPNSSITIEEGSANASLTLNSDDTIGNESIGIYMLGTLNVKSGTLIAKSGNASKFSLGINCGDVGDGKIGNLIVRGGNVLAESGNVSGNITDSFSCPICVLDEITISGGNISTISNSASYGIQIYRPNTNKGMTITGGKVTAAGDGRAIYGNVINTIAGTGWTDVDGTQGKTTIPVNTDWHSIEYKKVSFPATTTTTYTATVNNGTGSGAYAQGATVSISANPPATGKVFDKWDGADNLTFTTGSATTANAAFSMPANAVTVTATYKDATSGNGNGQEQGSGGNDSSQGQQGQTPSSDTQGQDQQSGNDDQATNPTTPSNEDKTENIDNSQKNAILSKPKAGKKSFTLKWKKSKDKGIAGYQIQYSTDKSFKNDVKTVTISKPKTTSKTIKKLKSKKKYYIRIRTYKKSGAEKIYSKWSKAKSVKVK